MLSRILRFELKYHYSQTVFRIALLVFFLLGMVAVRGGFGADVYKNSPYAIMNITGLISLCTIFSGTLFCASVVLRDQAYRFESMVFTTSISKQAYFMIRFTGLFLSVMTSLVFTSLGMIAGCLLLPSSELGDFNFLFHLYSIIVIGAPNVLLCCAVLFSAAVLTGNIRFVYASGVLLYVCYWAGSMLGNSPLLANSDPLNAPGDLALIADPFALSIFFSETKPWTLQQKNNLLLPLDGIFLVNRLVWIGISLLVLLITFRFFRFGLKLQNSTRQKNKKEDVSRPLAYQASSTSVANWSYLLRSFSSQLKLETIALFKHIPFMVMMIVWVFMYAVELKDTLYGGVYSIRSYPDAALIIEQFAVIRPALVLIIFYAAELSWRERSANMHSLIYSSPVKNIVPWAAKLSCLAILIAFVITANIGIGLAIQLLSGYQEPDVMRYLQLYYYCGFPLLLFAVLMLFIVTVIPNKYLGILVGALAAAVVVFSSRLGIEHYLLRYASVPELSYTAMNGFGRNADSFDGYMLYWSGFAILLSVGSICLWQNTRAIGFKQRLAQLRTQLNLKTSLVLATGIVIWVTMGSWIYYQTNTVGGFKSREAYSHWQIAYEKKYKAKALSAQPVIRSVKTEVDLYPSGQRYTINGTYRVKNESNATMKSVWIGIDPSVTSANITIPAATLTDYDAPFGQYEYLLNQPLKPDSILVVSFTLDINRSGFTAFDVENNVAGNGTYIELEKFIPYFGYNDRFETADKSVRRENNLPEEPVTLLPDTLYHLVDYETTISTDQEQEAISVGVLNKKWQKDGRSYFNYRSSQPIPFMFALSSAKYQVKREMYDNTMLQIYYHPGHEMNTAAMLQGMKDALDYCGKNFGRYPFPVLTLAEIPQYAGAATSYPGLMFNAERINYLSDYSDPEKVNQAYAIAVHETAHEWWGTKLQPSPKPGRKVITETLAKYTENMVIEQRFGKMYLRNYLENDSRLYFVYRSFTEDEHAMDTVIGQPFVYYQKGGIGMYAIQDQLGDQTVNAALSLFLKDHEDAGIGADVSGLKQALSNGRSTQEVNLINDLFSKRVTWDLSVGHASSKQLPDGKFEIECEVLVKKMDGSYHSSTEIAANDSIYIAAFDEVPARWSAKTTPVFIRKHLLKSGKNTLRFIADKKPAAVSIDPYSLILDADPSDNTKVLP
jgi:hypothetical protein